MRTVSTQTTRDVGGQKPNCLACFSLSAAVGCYKLGIWCDGATTHCSSRPFGWPCQNDIGEQREGPTDGVRIILGSPVLRLDPPGKQRALEGMERFTLGQQATNLPPEFGIDEIIEHEHARMTLPTSMPHS